MNNILYENEACLVINKLCGIDSEHPEGAFGLKPVNRLDQPATGCLLYAKSTEAAAFLSAAFSGNVEKRYWAVIEKPRTPDIFSDTWKEITHWITFNSRQNKSYAHDTEKPGSVKAVMRARLIGVGENYFFLEIDLMTGRHHQIRAQLAALGIHIKGDLKYGARRSEKTGGIRLHARSLRFPNPVNPAETVFIEAPPPIMDALWEGFISAVL